MINIDEFIKRLEQLLDYYNISASVFADKLGVQRSGLSHLLSGRNKPSLDFVMKITDSFPEVDLYWLLEGKGNFPKGETVFKDDTRPVVPPSPAPPELKPEAAQGMPDLFSITENTPQQNSMQDENSTAPEKNITIGNAGEIERIVVFYKNGVFKNYTPGH